MVMTPADTTITPAKVDRGKAFFFDPRRSASVGFSCNSCHTLATDGDDNLETSNRCGWQNGPCNAFLKLNAVCNIAQLWDSRADDLKAQVKDPAQAGVEAVNTPENAVASLHSMPRYVTWFKVAFPGETDPVAFDYFAKPSRSAMSHSRATPFDAFLGSLTGEMPQVVYPVPPGETAASPRPTGEILPE